jgi:hypothetical protein
MLPRLARALRLAACLALLPLSGCDEQRTELLVIVHAENALAEQVAAIRVRATKATGRTNEEQARVVEGDAGDGEVSLPLNMLVVPESDEGAERVDIAVDVFDAGDGVLASARVQVPFDRGRVRALFLTLSAACGDRFARCALSDDGCVRCDACLEPVLDRLPAASSRLEQLVGVPFCAVDPPRDGGVAGDGGPEDDGGSGDADVIGPRDASVSRIAGGGGVMCALRDEELYCWGNNGVGELGRGTASWSEGPMPVVGLRPPIGAFGTGSIFTDGYGCAVDADGLKCWGGNSLRQLGIGPDYVVLVPTPVRAFAQP